MTSKPKTIGEWAARKLVGVDKVIRQSDVHSFLEIHCPRKNEIIDWEKPIPQYKFMIEWECELRKKGILPYGDGTYEPGTNARWTGSTVN